MEADEGDGEGEWGRGLGDRRDREELEVLVLGDGVDMGGDATGSKFGTKPLGLNRSNINVGAKM